MNSTFQNSAQVLSIGIFFTLMIVGPRRHALDDADAGPDAPRRAAAAARHIGALPPVSILFAAFLGYNPIKTLVGPAVLGQLSPANRAALTGHSFFPNLISAPVPCGPHRGVHLRRHRLPDRRRRLLVARQPLRPRRMK